MVIGLPIFPCFIAGTPPAKGWLFTRVMFFDKYINHKTNGRVAQRPGRQEDTGNTIP